MLDYPNLDVNANSQEKKQTRHSRKAKLSDDDHDEIPEETQQKKNKKKKKEKSSECNTDVISKETFPRPSNEFLDSSKLKFILSSLTNFFGKMNVFSLLKLKI